jgi:hypothetical protein
VSGNDSFWFSREAQRDYCSARRASSALFRCSLGDGTGIIVGLGGGFHGAGLSMSRAISMRTAEHSGCLSRVMARLKALWIWFDNVSDGLNRLEGRVVCIDTVWMGAIVCCVGAAIGVDVFGVGDGNV